MQHWLEIIEVIPPQEIAPFSDEDLGDDSSAIKIIIVVGKVRASP
jgi:hypothetical protein